MAELEQEGLAGNDPFSPEQAPGWLVVLAMRNYDLQVAILDRLEDLYEVMADKKIPEDQRPSNIIYDAHKAGLIVSDFPSFTPPTEDK